MKISVEKDTKEFKTQGLIQFLGDITVKSIGKHEMESAKEGIDSLTEIATKFLELKSKNETTYKVYSDSPFVKTTKKNQYVKYVLNEFENVFNQTTAQHDSTTSRHLIMQLFRILDKVMVGNDNWFILTDIVDTRNVLGSTYTKLLRSSLENKLSLESNLLTRHLVDIPQFAVFERKYKIEYVSEFINYHIYRVTKLIIYADNLEAFSNEMDHFYNSLTFRDPVETASRISGSIYTHSIVDSSKLKTIEELTFGIEVSSLKDFTYVFKILDKLEEYKKTLFKLSDQDSDETFPYIDKIKKQIIDLYISLLVHGVFFKIGALIVSMVKSKGASYAQYVEELWYHAKPLVDTSGMNLNSTPIPNSIDWITLYTVYSGTSSSQFYDFYTFEDFPDSELYHYQYCALLMIKLGTAFSFNIQKMEQIKSQGNSEQFQHYYELASIMDVQKFIDAINEVANNKALCSIIRVENVSRNIEIVREKLNQLKEDQNTILRMFARHGELNSGKIDEIKKQFANKYLSDSIADKISSPKYDVNLESTNLIERENTLQVRRDFFIDQGFSSNFLLDPSVSELATVEMNDILKAIQSKIEPIHQDMLDFAEQIRTNVRLLRNDGKNPDVIFLPLDVEMELWRSELFDYNKKRIITVDDIDLTVINSWNQFDFTDIVIFDSSCMNITYKAENKEKRIDIREFDTEAGKDHVSFSCKITFLVGILNPAGFRRIINDNISLLKTKNDNKS